MFNRFLLGIFCIQLFACQNAVETEGNCTNVTSMFYQFEESNRIEFREFIVKHHLNSNNSNELNLYVIEFYDIIDTLLEDLLIKSGGYDPESAVLVGAWRTDICDKVIREHAFFETIKLKFDDFKSTSISSEDSEQLITEIESILYPILKFWDYDKIEQFPVAKLYIELMIIQNKLLIAEVKYFETL